jgi:integrase
VEFGPLRLKAAREKMIQAGLSRNVVNKHVGRIKRIFKWGAENELLSGSVSHALAAVSGLRKGRSEARETEPVKPVPDQPVEAVKPFVSPQVWAMVELQRLTGMRPGEARIMRGCDLDMTGTLWEYRPVAHKTEHHDKERVVPIGPRAQAVIRPFLKSETTAFLFSPAEAEAHRNAERRQNRNSPMTPSQQARKPKGRRLNDFYTKDACITAIRRACKKAGVPTWHPNQLRHSSGTRIRKELGLEAAQVWLGHSKADVTQIYAERNLELARQIAAKYG